MMQVMMQVIGATAAHCDRCNGDVPRSCSTDQPPGSGQSAGKPAWIRKI